MFLSQGAARAVLLFLSPVELAVAFISCLTGINQARKPLEARQTDRATNPSFSIY